MPTELKYSLTELRDLRAKLIIAGFTVAAETDGVVVPPSAVEMIITSANRVVDALAEEGIR